MPYVINASSSTEMQGTDGKTGDFTPLIYATGAQLIIEKLSGPGGSVVAVVPAGTSTETGESVNGIIRTHGNGPGGGGGGGGGGGITGGAYKPIAAEVNVGGRIVYGSQLTLTSWVTDLPLDGYYRLRFILPSTANVNITTADAGTVASSKEVRLEIRVDP